MSPLLRLISADCLPDQEERTKAIEAFKEGKKDVLVATDVASKGLDFPAIQHVVNYDMPEEIENYGKADRVGWKLRLVKMLNAKIPFFLPLVHRIGRTGRSGKTGIATTFINKGCGKEKWKIYKSHRRTTMYMNRFASVLRLVSEHKMTPTPTRCLGSYMNFTRLF